MLGEYATELANIIDDLTNHVYRLRGWDEIISELGYDQKIAVSHEFLNTQVPSRLANPLLSSHALPSPPVIYAVRQTGQGNRRFGWMIFLNRTSTSTILNLMALVGESSAPSRFKWKQSQTPPSRLHLMTSGRL